VFVEWTTTVGRSGGRNDSVPKYLYRNKHDGTFEDISYLSGFALNDDGREQAAME